MALAIFNIDGTLKETKVYRTDNSLSDVIDMINYIENSIQEF